jgi:polyhydroxybutyrate depolymerase
MMNRFCKSMQRLGLALLYASALSPFGSATASIDGLIPVADTSSFSATMSYGGLSRSYNVVQPKDAPAGAPVLLLLHPRETTALAMLNLSHAAQLSAAYGAWVIAPEAVNGQWHDDPSATGPQADYPDDVGYLSALIDYALDTYQLDPKRVYVAGYSNGGFMAQRLACDITSKIAAVGAVAATMRVSQPAACRPTRALPVAIVMGTQDWAVWYQGNSNYISAAQVTQFWTSNDRCTGSPTDIGFAPVAFDPTSVSMDRYPTCTPGNEVRLYTVTKGGHTWPGSNFALPFLGRTSHVIDATDELWSFFLGYTAP